MAATSVNRGGSQLEVCVVETSRGLKRGAYHVMLESPNSRVPLSSTSEQNQERQIC
jgi:hypothetical protein